MAPKKNQVTKYAEGVKIYKVSGKQQWFVVDHTTSVPPGDAADSPESFFLDSKGKYRLKSILLPSERDANKMRDDLIEAFKKYR
jgi:hypothetical protein